LNKNAEDIIIIVIFCFAGDKEDHDSTIAAKIAKGFEGFKFPGK
jgi:hypothetical protein